MGSHKIVAVISRDLIFKSKISSTAQASGVATRSVRELADLDRALAEGATLVIFDLSVKDVDRTSVLARVREKGGSVRMVAYLSHVEHELEDLARSEGFEEIMPRSAFVRVLPELFT